MNDEKKTLKLVKDTSPEAIAKRREQMIHKNNTPGLSPVSWLTWCIRCAMFWRYKYIRLAGAKPGLWDLTTAELYSRG